MRKGFVQIAGVAIGSAVLGAIGGTSTFFLFLGGLRAELRTSVDGLKDVVNQVQLQVERGQGQYSALEVRTTRSEQDIQKWNTEIAAMVSKAVKEGTEKGIEDALRESRQGFLTPATASRVSDLVKGENIDGSPRQ